MSTSPSLKDTYITCQKQAIKNVIWFGFFTAVTIGVGIVSRRVGIVLGVISALVMSFEAIRVAIVVILDIIVLPINLFSAGRRLDEPEWIYGHLSTLVQLIEALICFAYLVILYLFFWQPALLFSYFSG